MIKAIMEIKIEKIFLPISAVEYFPYGVHRRK